MSAAHRNSRKNAPAQRELSRLHRILSVRERQLAACIATLKGIIEFKSAAQSIFSTEVQELQRIALEGLCHAQELQQKRKGRVLVEPGTDLIDRKAAQASLELRQGRFVPRGSDDD